ncbi:squalene/phytoene synthase family protein [Pseudoruegeria sp. SK021]|uniref:squalene/phytoene synthase family protein n=1 Tax=Pseudoruegeria sp. SK021 TaxID=1933035 RepID=UPI000A2488AC|nr:squalene/phytoene synthase family protein [Pseudoruegeria sp. SK021]OSP54278.1 phytoene synthase [Pseudoruegeria sp. SK021]
MSLDACAALVQRGDPDRWLSLMSAPLAARRVLLPIYAFNLEVARAPWVTVEPTIAEMRLQWWRDALEEIALGGAVRRHEVVTPLAAVIDGEAARLLDRLVMARRWDIYRDPFEDKDHFDTYLAHTAGELMWVAARALGATDPGPVADMARASGLAAWFLAIPELEARGRQPLVDGRPEAVRELAEDGLVALRRARCARAQVPVAARPALRAGWRAGYLLSSACKDPLRVVNGALAESEARRRASLIWHASWGSY